jgi:hypothetical protein
LFVIAALVSCGYWLLSGACTPPGGGGGGGGRTEEPADNGDVPDDTNDNAPDEPDANDNQADEPDTNGDAGEGLVVSEAGCAVVDEAGNDFETQVEATTEDGRELTYTRRVTANPDLGGGLLIETEVTADGEMVMLITTTVNSSGGVQVDVEYGAAIPGVESASATVEDGTLSGEIDGRGLVPMDADDADLDALSFEDGELPPEHGADPELEAALAALFEVAADTAEECAESTEEFALAVPMIPPQDSGQDWDAATDGGCIACWAGCSSGAAACIGGVSAGCVAALIAYAACEAIGVGACGVAYLACVGGCNATGSPCCPVACGSVACCGSDETCLNSDIGLCCSPGKTPCMGENCCSSTEVCIESGPNAGICCQPEDICGNTCCDPTDSCEPDFNLCCSASEYICGSTCCDDTESCQEEVSLCCPAGEETCTTLCCPAGETCLSPGLCCDPNLICGSACCDDLDAGCIPELSLCCGFDQDPCDDTCCEIGEDCVGGATCCPQARICGDVCCPEGHGCDTQTEQCTACPNPTDTPCVVGGCCPAGTFCQDVEGFCCNEGEICCDAITCSGGCQPISECID